MRLLLTLSLLAAALPAQTVLFVGRFDMVSLDAANERLRASGYSLKEELGIVCCHARQDKFWVKDPDGNSWEFYIVTDDMQPEKPPADLPSNVNVATASVTAADVTAANDTTADVTTSASAPKSSGGSCCSG